VPRDQRDGYLRPYSRLSRQEPQLFLSSSSQLHTRGSVDPVPDPLLLSKSGSAGNRTQTSGSGSIARNSDHWTTEVVPFMIIFKSMRMTEEECSTYGRDK
jgi:hypothetical protein